jgi:hypothetical protein
MKMIVLPSLVTAALALVACDRPPATKSEFNNSGASATAAMPASAPTVTASSGSDASGPSTTAPAANSPADATASAGPATVVGDTVTTGKVKAAIAGDTGMKDSDISVETSAGVVTLTGSAKSQDQVGIATALAQRQDGVQRVDSRVVVK